MTSSPESPLADNFDRPYDPTQLARLTAHYEQRLLDRIDEESAEAWAKSRPEPIFDPSKLQVSTNDTTPEKRPETVSVPRTIYELGKNALRGACGVRHIVSKEKRQEKRDHRMEVVSFLGEKMLYPRGTNTKITKKIAWVGTDTFKVDDRDRVEFDEPDNFNDLGRKLFRKTEPVEKANRLRPTSLSEKITSIRLEGQLEKKHKAENESRWLNESYKPLKSSEDYQLSLGERFVRSYRLHESAHLDRKASRATKKFRKIIRKGISTK